MEIIFAGSNQGKFLEFEASLANTPIKLIKADKVLEVIEDGKTFSENALLKAKAYANFYKKAAISDDSGLVLNAFPQLLGVQSARFAEHLSNYTQKCQAVLDLYKNNPQLSREAHFHCTLCFYKSDNEIFFFEAKLYGMISNEIMLGEGGFGFDPIFIPNINEKQGGQSLSQLPTWKEQNSHRSLALKKFIEFVL